ncbi:MAG: YciI family protein [Phycisphaerales bacterium]|nr:YciI family protein [Phycisphaerales bacterium]
MTPLTPLGIVLLLALLVVGGCTTAEPGRPMHGPTPDWPAPGSAADYVFVYLKSGPTSGQGSKEDRAAMFAGHMANINRLASEKSLLIAGPFGAPRDKSWRGVFVLDVATIAEAQALAATDPGVQAGEFIVEEHRMRASAELRLASLAEALFQAEMRANPDAKTPEIRKYVMITTTDLDRCARALERITPPVRTIWSGWFIDSQRGVVVVDANDASVLETAMNAIDPDAGAADGWFSTSSLTGFSPDAATWRR